METKFTLRQAASSDAALLAELGARIFHETFAADNALEDMAAYLETAFHPNQVAKELSDPRALFLIAESEGAPIGYAKLLAGEPEPCVAGPRPIELVRLYVQADWHGKGVGAELMRACLEQAQTMGFETIWLGVWPQNRRADAFYRKWGFREVGTHTFQFGSDAQTDLVMERSLKS